MALPDHRNAFHSLRHHVFFLLPICALLLTGCQTLDRRIEKNLDYFLSLPESHRQLIEAEQIAVGFTTREVYLAWGDPFDKIVSETGGGTRETWVYTSIRSRTVYRTVRRYDPDRKSWVLTDEPFTFRREYVTKDVVFLNGEVEKWTMYDEGVPYYDYPYDHPYLHRR